VSACEALKRETGERLAEWLALVEGASSEGFTRVERFEEIPAAARADSWFWCDCIFASELSPHNEALAPKHAFHRATADKPDLLRHEYKAGGLDLVVTESRNFVLVQVARSSLDILALQGAERGAAIQRVADALFNRRRGTSSRGSSGHDEVCAPLPVPSGVDEGTCFSSDPEVDPSLLSCWSDRIECGIRDGRLYFLIYKKMAQCAGYANASQWFDEGHACDTRLP
jgi:hypothetical protein